MSSDTSATETTLKVSYLVKISLTADGSITSISELFSHELRDTLTPDVELLNAMLENAGLPIQVVELTGNI